MIVTVTKKDPFYRKIMLILAILVGGLILLLIGYVIWRKENKLEKKITESNVNGKLNVSETKSDDISQRGVEGINNVSIPHTSTEEYKSMHINDENSCNRVLGCVNKPSDNALNGNNESENFEGARCKETEKVSVNHRDEAMNKNTESVEPNDAIDTANLKSNNNDKPSGNKTSSILNHNESDLREVQVSMNTDTLIKESEDITKGCSSLQEKYQINEKSNNHHDVYVKSETTRNDTDTPEETYTTNISHVNYEIDGKDMMFKDQQMQHDNIMEDTIVKQGVYSHSSPLNETAGAERYSSNGLGYNSSDLLINPHSQPRSTHNEMNYNNTDYINTCNQINLLTNSNLNELEQFAYPNMATYNDQSTNKWYKNDEIMQNEQLSNGKKSVIPNISLKNFERQNNEVKRVKASDLKQFDIQQHLYRSNDKRKNNDASLMQVRAPYNNFPVSNYNTITSFEDEFPLRQEFFPTDETIDEEDKIQKPVTKNQSRIGKKLINFGKKLHKSFANLSSVGKNTNSKSPNRFENEDNSYLRHKNKSDRLKKPKKYDRKSRSVSDLPNLFA
ncbi:hypothetical protein THOM_1609 [Trachipleistophora hominis]|uniref:Uncharacterized protein n=1 Tax=Trachipleistophora hominis TaxID=72359 RepID=L7JWI1_TRAHO|nr:hypothetical protein THOM_1609 [Trachipleistophora hominis]